MAEYAVAHLAQIDEISDGRCPFRPIRHNFGITSFGVNVVLPGHRAECSFHGKATLRVGAGLAETRVSKQSPGPSVCCASQ